MLCTTFPELLFRGIDLILFTVAWPTIRGGWKRVFKDSVEIMSTLKDPCFAVFGSMRNPAQYRRIRFWFDSRLPSIIGCPPESSTGRYRPKWHCISRLLKRSTMTRMELFGAWTFVRCV